MAWTDQENFSYIPRTTHSEVNCTIKWNELQGGCWEKTRGFQRHKISLMRARRKKVEDKETVGVAGRLKEGG